METQENKNSEKKEITYPKFIQERLDRIPWEELESQYGIKKDYIMSREQIARQLANGQVTDYVNCYARVGNLTVMGPMALQANFRGDRVEVKHFTVNPNPDLSVYGDALRSEKVAERLLDSYDFIVRDEEGKAVRKEVRHSFANGGSPITLARTAADGTVTPAGLPKSDVLYFELEDDAWVCIRPSGTEPKIKLYVNTNAKSHEASAAQNEALVEACKALMA